MQHLRRGYTTSTRLASLRSFYWEVSAADAGRNASALASRPLTSSSLAARQHLLLASGVLPGDYRSHWSGDGLQVHALHCSRGFAAQTASRLKRPFKRPKRIAHQQHGSKAGALTRHTDPTSNDAIESIPQDETSVQASQSQASELQVHPSARNDAMQLLRRDPSIHT